MIVTVWTLLTQSTKRSQVDQTSSSLVRTHIFTCWCTSAAALNTPRLFFFVYGSIFIHLPLSFYFHSTCFSPLLTSVLMGVSFSTSLWFLNLLITFSCFERFFGDECQSVLLSLWIQRCWSAEKSWRSLRLLNFSFFLFLYICLCHSRSLILSTSICTIHISFFLSALFKKNPFVSVISSFSSYSRNELMNYFSSPLLRSLYVLRKFSKLSWAISHIDSHFLLFSPNA